ncbi:DUF7686 domain-containing protein [Azoarcus taiwanensis]
MDVQTIRCEGCGERTPSHDIITYGSMDRGHRQLCSRCFNAEVARLNGLEGFEDFRFEPIGLVDCAGETHQFHFRTRLLGNIVALDAFELRDGHPSGYQCELVGDREDDLLGLLGRLVEKLRRMLSVKHLTGEGPEFEIAAQTVLARISHSRPIGFGSRAFSCRRDRSELEVTATMSRAAELMPYFPG